MHTHHRGFTLIELLVVIAIIGVLSSVVLASLNTARSKAKDAALKSEVRQLAILMALEYDDSQSYSALATDQWFPSSGCSGSFSGNYATQARALCTSITSKAGLAFGSNFGLYMGSASGGQKFSIMANLPGKGTWFCIGSSGVTSDTEPASGNGWNTPGCLSIP